MLTLPRYEIVVSPAHLQYLNRHVWTEHPVPAFINIGSGPQEIRLKYRGAHTRLFSQKSYYIQLKGREWHLNADVVDPSHIRSKWSFDWFGALSVLAPRATHVSLSINGDERGVYTLLESVDKHFLARRRLASGDLFYAIDNRANFSLVSETSEKRLKKRLIEGYELKEKHTPGAKRHLEQFIWQLNTVPKHRLQTWLNQTVEVHHYLRWLAGAVLTSNADGFIHNYALYRHPQTLRWWIIPWDYDGTWGRDCYGKRMSAEEIPLFGYNRLTERILSVPAFRHYYVRLMSKLLRNRFVKKRLLQEAHSLMSKVRPAVYTTARNHATVERFEAEMTTIEHYVMNRRHFLKKELGKWQKR